MSSKGNAYSRRYHHGGGSAKRGACILPQGASALGFTDSRGGGCPPPPGPLSACAYDDAGEEFDEQLCNADDGSPLDLYRLAVRPDAAKRDTRLRPYLLAREVDKPDGLTLRIVGSAVAATWQYLLFFAAYATGMAFLFDYVIEEEVPGVFDVPWTSFINSAMFAVGFFLSARLFGALNQYGEGIRAFFDVADAIGTGWLHVQAQAIRFPLSYCVPVPRYARPPAACVASGNLDARAYVRTVYVQKVRVYEEMQDIARALIFALKWQFRTKPATSRFEANVSSDVDLGAPSVDPFRLPMVSYLQNELAQAETDYVTGLLAMWASRVALLVTDGEGDATRASYQEEFAAFVVHINAVGTQVSRVSALQVLGLPQPVTDLLWLGLITVFVLQPWALWVDLSYYMLIVYGLELVFFFSIWGLAQNIGNPYNRTDDSPFIFHDIGELSRGVAKNVDDQADKFVAEILSLNEFNKQRGYTGDAGHGGGKAGAIGDSVTAVRRGGGGANRQRFDAIGAAVTPGNDLAAAATASGSWSERAAWPPGNRADDSAAYHVHNSIGSI